MVQQEVPAIPHARNGALVHQRLPTTLILQHPLPSYSLGVDGYGTISIVACSLVEG